MLPKIGILALARDTFDVPFAREIHSQCLAELRKLSIEIVGGSELLFDAAATQQALNEVNASRPDLLAILQVTFTDSSMTSKIAEQTEIPLLLWSFPEERTGGRLRLNSFCGINLAAHTLSRKGRPYHYLHGLASEPQVQNKFLALVRAAHARSRFHNATMLVIGEFPEGFDACDYDPAEVKETFGLEFHNMPVSRFIQEARQVPEAVAAAHLEERKKVLGKLEQLEQEPLLNTMRVYHRLDELVKEKNAIGAAVRCWPQFFTEWGTAACGALAMMGEQKIPCGCEADVYGVLTAKLLALISGGAAVFNTDLVDLDFASNTCVFWHCGQAPVQMADPEIPPVGTIHTNRKLPLLSQFPLKPGQITLARLSRGGGKLKLVLGQAEMLKAPLAYAGTSGVARFPRPLEQVVDTLMNCGLEHHTAIVYGDYLAELKAFAQLLSIQTVEL